MTNIGKVISGLEKTVSHFKSVQNAQRENGRYVSASFKEFENACSDAIGLISKYKDKQCTLCKFYQGVHNVQGHAPCSKLNKGFVLWDDHCPLFEKVADNEMIHWNQLKGNN